MRKTMTGNFQDQGAVKFNDFLVEAYAPIKTGVQASDVKQDDPEQLKIAVASLLNIVEEQQDLLKQFKEGFKEMERLHGEMTNLKINIEV